MLLPSQDPAHFIAQERPTLGTERGFGITELACRAPASLLERLQGAARGAQSSRERGLVMRVFFWSLTPRVQGSCSCTSAASNAILLECASCYLLLAERARFFLGVLTVAPPGMSAFLVSRGCDAVP